MPELKDIIVYLQEVRLYIQLFAPVSYVLLGSAALNVILFFRKPLRLKGNKRTIENVKAYKFKTRRFK